MIYMLDKQWSTPIRNFIGRINRVVFWGKPGKVIEWTYNIHEQYGIELDLVNGFCKAHEHLPKLSQPITNETVLTKSMVQNYSDMLIHPKMKEDIEADGDPFNLLGDIKVHVAKARQIVAISSTGIKFVARKSNFNVDVQNKNGLYRGYCNICGKDMSLTREEILDLDKEKASLDFDEFLKIHLHDGSDRELPKGRKFRHASKQG